MAYDGLFTKKMVESLQSLVSGRIHKINQPENDTIIMVGTTKPQKSSITIINSPSFSRLQITDKNMITHLIHLCSRVFRKHLEGGFIEKYTPNWQ